MGEHEAERRNVIALSLSVVIVTVSTHGPRGPDPDGAGLERLLKAPKKIAALLQ